MISDRRFDAVRVPWRSAVVAGLFAALVAGCGGGGGQAATTSSAPTASATALGAGTGTLGDGGVQTEPIAPVLDGSNLPHGVPGDLPDGTYRLTVVRDDIAALALPAEIADAVIAENIGTYTWRLKAGRWHMDQDTTPAPATPSVDGTYVVAGDNVTFYFPSGMTFNIEQALSGALPPAPVENFRWSVANGAMTLTALDGTDPIAAGTMAAHPWQPVAVAAV